jgi:hypothetical protein
MEEGSDRSGEGTVAALFQQLQLHGHGSESDSPADDDRDALRRLQQSCSSLLPLRRRRGSLESPKLQELRVMETLIPCAIQRSLIMIPQLMLLLASRLMSSIQQLRP